MSNLTAEEFIEEFDRVERRRFDDLYTVAVRLNNKWTYVPVGYNTASPTLVFRYDIVSKAEETAKSTSESFPALLVKIEQAERIVSLWYNGEKVWYEADER